MMLSTLHRPFMVLRSSGESTSKEHGQLLVQSCRVALSRILALVAGICARPLDDGLRSCVDRALPILRSSGMHAAGDGDTAFFVDKSLFPFLLRFGCRKVWSPGWVMNRYSWFEDKSLLTWKTWSIVCDLNTSTSAGESGIKFGAIVFIGDLRTLVMNSAFIHFTTKYIDGLKLATHTMLQVAHVMNAAADRWGYFKGHDTGVMRGN